MPFLPSGPVLRLKLSLNCPRQRTVKSPALNCGQWCEHNDGNRAMYRGAVFGAPLQPGSPATSTHLVGLVEEGTGLCLRTKFALPQLCESMAGGLSWCEQPCRSSLPTSWHLQAESA